jgi:alpha-mannosidase
LLQAPHVRSARDAELGLLAVAAGENPLAGADEFLLSVEPRVLVLSALKPADYEDGFVVRLLNPTDEEHEAIVGFGFDVVSAEAVRLDEQRDDFSLKLSGRELRFAVPPHALRSVRCT